MEAALAALAGTEVWPDAGPLEASVRAMPLLLAHDLPGANATLDAGRDPSRGTPRGRPAAPVRACGCCSATVVDDRGAEARDVLRGLPVALRRANRGALHYADAVAAGRGRAVRRGRGVVRPRRGRSRPRCPGCTGCSGSWCSRPPSPTAGASPIPLLRRDLAEHERAGDSQLARTCRDLLKRAGAPTRRGRGDSPVPGALRAAGVTSREMDVLGLVPRA